MEAGDSAARQRCVSSSFVNLHRALFLHRRAFGVNISSPVLAGSHLPPPLLVNTLIRHDHTATTEAAEKAQPWRRQPWSTQALNTTRTHFLTAATTLRRPQAFPAWFRQSIPAGRPTSRRTLTGRRCLPFQKSSRVQSRPPTLHMLRPRCRQARVSLRHLHHPARHEVTMLTSILRRGHCIPARDSPALILCPPSPTPQDLHCLAGRLRLPHWIRSRRIISIPRHRWSLNRWRLTKDIPRRPHWVLGILTTLQDTQRVLITRNKDVFLLANYHCRPTLFPPGIVDLDCHHHTTRSTDLLCTRKSRSMGMVILEVPNTSLPRKDLCRTGRLMGRWCTW